MKKDLLSGFFFTSIGKFGTFFIQIIINSLLARLLSPSDYGIFAIVFAFLTLFQYISDAGIGAAIVQNKSLTKKDINIIFNFNILLSIILAILFGFFGYIVSLIYKQDILVSLCWFSSISLFNYGISIIPMAVLRKNKRFKLIGLIQIIGALVNGVTGITLALIGLKVYSLVFAIVISSGLVSISTIYFSKVKISKAMKLEPLKKIINFTKNQFIYNILMYISKNIDNFLVGKFISTSALGNYNKAYSLTSYPTTMLDGIFTPVLQPILSDFEKDYVKMRKLFFKLVKTVTLLTLPLSLFMSLTGEEIIIFLFGDQWIQSIIPFKIMVLAIWMQILVSMSASIFQSRNKTKEMVNIGTVSTIIVSTGIIIGVSFEELIFVALGMVCATFVSFIITFFFLVEKILFDNFFVFLKCLRKPLIFGLIIALEFITYNKFVNVSNLFFDLVVRTLVFLFTMIILFIISKEYKSVIEYLK